MGNGVVRALGAAGLAVALAVVAVPTTGSARTTGGVTTNAAPTPAAPIPGKPTSIAAIGDSITQSTGTGPISQENPQNNWATGWSIDSLAAKLGIPTGQRYNYAANGNRMTHFVGEVNNGKSGGSGDVSPMPSSTGLVVVELGGNDLCRDSVASMTSVADYRAQFKAGLAAIAAKAPTALIQVMSVPDIYNLWYIRGSIQDPASHPEPMSDQAQGINGAWDYWDGTFKQWGIFTFPCQSLLDNPDSLSDADNARRLQVRQRNMEYNDVLAQECAKVLRCTFDDKGLFDVTSNRVNPPNGPLLPYSQWRLTDQDISRNTKSACPLTGLTSSGCGDHFHPSVSGQQKLANAAWTYGRNWADTTFPTAGGAVVPSTRPDGLHHGRATVAFTGSDNVGLRGQEVRVHNPDGSVTGWTPSIGVAPNLTVSKVGLSYVEVRSLDVNGNLSGGTLIPVNVVDPLVPAAPPAPTFSSSTSGLQVSWKAPSDDGGAAVSSYALTALTGAPSPSPAGAPTSVAATSTTPSAPPAGEVVTYEVAATNTAGTGATSPPSAATVAPFASLSSFLRRQYIDFVGRPPTTAELWTDIDALQTGKETPISLVDRLRSGTWFDGAYGPSVRLYRAYFLRVPDPSGLEYWVRRRRAGVTLAKISLQFSVSSEFQRRYGTLDDATFIDTVYHNVFNRAPDPSGRAFYQRRLAAGWNRGQVVLQFSESSEYKRLTLPLVTVVELGRAMTGSPLDQVATEYRLLDYTNGGSKAVFAYLISTPDYRTRAVS